MPTPGSRASQSTESMGACGAAAKQLLAAALAEGQAV